MVLDEDILFKNPSVEDNALKSKPKVNKTSNITDVIQNKNVIKLYLKHLTVDAETKYFTAANYLHKEFQITIPYSVIKRSSKCYISVVKKYMESIHNRIDPIHEVDKEFIVLDLVATANEELLKQSKQLSNETIKAINNNASRNNKVSQETYIKLKNNLDEFVLESKKEDMAYICNNLEICRPHPAYSDYMLDLLNKISRLSNNRLNHIVMNLVVLFNERKSFFKRTLGESLTKHIRNNLEELYTGEILDIRKTVNVLKDVFKNKYKINKDVIRSKAINILIDIIDSSFTDEEILKIIFRHAFRSLNRWVKMKNYHILLAVNNLIRHSLDTFKYRWMNEIHQEVKTLVEIIMQRKVSNVNIYKYLFSEGSKLVKRKPEFDIDLI